MTEPSLVAQGLELMAFGMGTVFAFLTILVFITSFMSKLVTKLTPEEVAAPAPAAAGPQTQGVDLGGRRIIKTAVKEHRARQK